MSTANIDISEKFMNSVSKPIQNEMYTNTHTVASITRIGTSLVLSRSHICFIIQILFPIMLPWAYEIQG